MSGLLKAYLLIIIMTPKHWEFRQIPANLEENLSVNHEL